MIQKKQILRIVLYFILTLLIFTVAINCSKSKPQNAATSETSQKKVQAIQKITPALIKGIAGYIYVPNLNKSLESMGRIANKFQPGIGAVLKARVTSILQTKPELTNLDIEKPAVILCTDPKKYNRDPLLIIFHKLGKIKNNSNNPNPHQMNKDKQREVFDINDELCVFGMSDIIDDLKPELKKIQSLDITKKNNDIALSVNIELLSSIFKQDIDEGLKKLENIFKRMPQTQGQQQNQKILEMYLNLYVKLIKTLVNESKQFNANINFNDDFVTVSENLEVKPNTILSKFINDSKKFNPSINSKLNANNPTVVMGYNFPVEYLTKFWKYFLDNYSDRLPGILENQKFLDTVDESLDLLKGNFMESLTFDLEQGFSFNVIFEVNDSKKYLENMTKLFDTMVDDKVKQLFDSLGVKFTANNSIPDYKGIPIISQSIDFSDLMRNNHMNRQGMIILQQMYGDSLKFYYAAVEDACICVGGKDAGIDTIKKSIDAVLEGKKLNTIEPPKDANGFLNIYLMSYIKFVYGMMPFNFTEPLFTAEDSKDEIPLSAKFNTTQNNFKVDVKVPVKTVATISNRFQEKMQQMQPPHMMQRPRK